MGKCFMGKKSCNQYFCGDFITLSFFQLIDWIPVTICCSEKKLAHKQSYQTFSVLVCILDDMGNSGSIAEIITHLETPLVGVKTNNCWTRKNDKISSQMFHQPPVVPLARLSSDTTRNRPHHRSARARNIILDRQEAWEEVIIYSSCQEDYTHLTMLIFFRWGPYPPSHSRVTFPLPTK